MLDIYQLVQPSAKFWSKVMKTHFVTSHLLINPHVADVMQRGLTLRFPAQVWATSLFLFHLLKVSSHEETRHGASSSLFAHTHTLGLHTQRSSFAPTRQFCHLASALMKLLMGPETLHWEPGAGK